MKGLVDQLPMTNPQLPKQFPLGVGIWNLAVDTSFSALRLIVATMAVLVIGGSATVLACPVCFGAEESPLIDGAKLGVVALVLVTLAVQLGFVSFFLYLRKRAKQVAELDLEAEWSDLQRGARSS
jgi:hypothetical protein